MEIFFFFGTVYFFPLVASLYLEERGVERERERTRERLGISSYSVVTPVVLVVGIDVSFLE